MRSPTAMNMLRAALGRHGIDDTDPSVEMAVNTVTFAEAASLVRRFVDPKHRPLGESGFYMLFPPALGVVDAWYRHIEGGSTLEETTDAIAKAVAGPAPSDSSGGTAAPWHRSRGRSVGFFRGPAPANGAFTGDVPTSTSDGEHRRL